jgi:PAS domain S-box-containing protein
LSYGRFDASPHATLVLRGGRIHYANEAVGRLLSMPPASLAGVALKDVLAPEEQSRVVERHRRRMHGELVPDSYETTLRAATGARRVVRVTAKREGDDVLVELDDLADDVARRERLTALACLGTAIQAESSARTVFEHVLAGVHELGLTCVLLREEGERAIIEAVRASPAKLAALESATAGPLEGLVGRWQPADLERLEVGAVFVDDVLDAIAGFFPPELARPFEAMRSQGLVRAGLVRVQGSGGPDHVLVLIGDWLRDDDVPALGMFGAQVSAALTGARVIGDLSRRNQELATLNRIATVARTASDLQSLLAQAVDEIVRFFDADGAAVFLIDGHEPCLVFEYAQGSVDASRSVFARIPQGAAGSQMWTIVRDARPRLFDIADFTGDVRRQLEGMGSRLVASAPLMARSAVLGVLNLHFRAPRALGERDLELLQVMGSHFGGAVESHRLMGELRERIDELTLVHEVGRHLVETLDIDQIYAAAARDLARALAVPAAGIILADGPNRMVIRATHGSDAAGVVLQRGEHGRMLWRVLDEQEAVFTNDATTDARFDEALTVRFNARAFIALPLVVHGRSIGVATVVDRAPRRFEPHEIERVASICNQIAVALDNARLYGDLKRSYAELARAQSQLVERERLAAVGELAAVVAHEVRNPLNVIFNSLGSLRRMLKPAGNAKMLLDIVGEEADRLNRIVGDLLDYVRPLAVEPAPAALDRVLDEALGSALAGAGGAVSLDCQVDGGLPQVPMDTRLVRQALLNLALNAVQAMPQGGTLTVRARVDGSPSAPVARIDLSDTGPGIPDEVRARIFEPFFTTKPTGTGLGLAVVKRIIEGHRGEVAVTSGDGHGTTFSIRLPLLDGAVLP